MKSLRLWTTVLILWLIFFFNIERLDSTIDIQSYTYIFVALLIAVTLALPELYWATFLILLVTFISLFLGFRVFMEEGRWYYNLFRGFALPITVTQVSAIIITGLLVRQIQRGLQEFEGIVANISFSHVGKLPQSFSEGQGPMYREVKRARRYHRPLAVIALTVDENDINILLPKMVQEVQHGMMRQYVLAGIARYLENNIHDFETIALRDNHFILVLPEITGEEADQIAQKLQYAIKENLKIELQIGTANFPGEAMTFESLVEMALKNTSQWDQVLTTPKQRATSQNPGDVRL